MIRKIRCQPLETSFKNCLPKFSKDRAEAMDFEVSGARPGAKVERDNTFCGCNVCNAQFLDVNMLHYDIAYILYCTLLCCVLISVSTVHEIYIYT